MNTELLETRKQQLAMLQNAIVEVAEKTERNTIQQLIDGVQLDIQNLEHGGESKLKSNTEFELLLSSYSSEIQLKRNNLMLTPREIRELLIQEYRAHRETIFQNAELKNRIVELENQNAELKKQMAESQSQAQIPDSVAVTKEAAKKGIEKLSQKSDSDKKTYVLNYSKDRRTI